MRVVLIEHTPNPDKVIAYAASQCYSEGFAGDSYNDASNPVNVEGIIKHVIKCGHTSTLEHSSFTFGIQGISRSCANQLTRFRVASFSQQSQRYVKFEEAFEFVTPSAVAKSPLLQEYFDFMEYSYNMYIKLINNGILAEDARYVLPNACQTNIVMTMNAREMHHAANLRCCSRAQWEIQNLFREMIKLVKGVAPITFAKAGATCEAKGFCPEGNKSCGKLNKVIDSDKQA